MANLYVAKDGSDSNNGTTWALAKLTIQAAVNIANSGDNINVGPGVYYEAVSYAITGDYSLTITGVGYVILDGANTLAAALTCSCTGTGTCTAVNLIVKRYTAKGFYGTASASTNYAVFTNCVFQNCNWAISYPVETSVSTITISGCLFFDNSGGALYTRSWDRVYISWSTFSDNGTVYYGYNGPNTLSTIKHCVFAFNTKVLDCFSLAYLATMDYNCIYFDGTQTCQGQTTFAGWKSASGRDTNSVSENPVFLDRAKDAYVLHTTSTVLTNVNESGTYGAGICGGLEAVGMSKNDPDGNWANRILSNTQVNGSDNIEPTANSGYARTPVINLGAVRKVRNINIITSLITSLYPTDVPDYSKSDVQPKKMTMRYRVSGSAFADGDSTPTWTEIEPSALGQDVSDVGQYVQAEATLRTDGA